MKNTSQSQNRLIWKIANHDYLRPGQTKPTSCNTVGPTMLHDVGRKFEAGLNLSQHLPTWCSNEDNIMQHCWTNDVA